MPPEVIVIRNPEFSRLEHDLALATARLHQASQAKQRLLAELSTQHSISLEDRHRFMELMRTEQEAYHALHQVQEMVAQLLRDENHGENRRT